MVQWIITLRRDAVNLRERRQIDWWVAQRSSSLTRQKGPIARTFASS